MATPFMPKAKMPLTLPLYISPQMYVQEYSRSIFGRYEYAQSFCLVAASP